MVASVNDELPWEILLIGGVSGSGKTMAARELSRRLAIPWLGVDDLRLALQWTRVRLPEQAETDALYFFLDTPDVRSLPPERLRDGLIEVSQLMAPAIEIVVSNHLDNAGPLIIEGDGILPSIVERPEIQRGLAPGRVRVIFLHEDDEQQLFENYRARIRGPSARPDAELRPEARVKAMFSAWVMEEARAHDLPVLASQPFERLAERILEVAETASGRENP